jgi:chemotaxis protein CheD
MRDKPPEGLAARVAAAVGSRPGGPGAIPSRAATMPMPLATSAPATARAATLPMPLGAPTARPPASDVPALSRISLSPRAAAPRPPAIRGWAAGTQGAMVSLMPGELHFGGEPASLRTLLGSCVAVTLWHPRRHIGGMCHFLLPSRTRAVNEGADGRYGDEAVGAMVQALRAHGTEPGDYVAHLYGGADTMSDASGVKFNVGERNIERGWALIDSHGFTLDGVDVGDNVPRTVTLTLATGEVQCRRGSAP